jgi:hypothetical protein
MQIKIDEKSVRVCWPHAGRTPAAYPVSNPAAVIGRLSETIDLIRPAVANLPGGVPGASPSRLHASASQRPMRLRIVVRLSSRTPVVGPPVPTDPVLIAVTASVAARNWFSRSCASCSRRDFDVSELPPFDAGVCFMYSVTAPAIALSRHRLKVRNSSTEIGTSVSMASFVTAWQTSP